VAIRAAGTSVSVGCQYCGALLDVANPDVSVIAGWRGAMAELSIPLGTRGTLFDIEWEVVGLLVRTSGEAEWEELLLFNPYAGYRWLVLSGGEWMFGTMLDDVPDEAAWRKARWRGDSYSQDGDGNDTIVTRRVIGEFYWRVRAGDRVNSTSFNHDGRTLSKEWTDSETNWTHLVPLSDRDVTRAFGLKGPLRPTGAPFPDYLVPMYLGAVVAFVLALLIGMWLSPSKQVFEAQALAASDQPAAHNLIGTITVAPPSQRVRFEVSAREFENGWVDVDVMLVDRASHQARHAATLVEHYRGRDADGRWREARLTDSADFSAVPAGTYDVVVELNAQRWFDTSRWAESPPPEDLPPLVVPLGFRVSTGGLASANAWVLLLLLLIVPVVMHWIWAMNRHGRIGDA
jgi:hypothetical protein